MTRFTKYTLLVAVLILAAAATAEAVIYSYRFRGYFSVGGEILIPAVVIAAWAIAKETKRLWKTTERNNHGKEF